MEMGTLPAMEMMEGMALAVGGALLITPGFITDTLGLLCLIPGTRRAMIRYLMARSVMVGSTHTRQNYGHHPHQGGPSQGGSHSGGRTIEGEFQRKDKF